MFFNLGEEIAEAQSSPWASRWRVDGFLATGRHFRHYRVRNLAPGLEQQEAVLKVIKYDPEQCSDAQYVTTLRQRLARERDTLAHFSPRLPEPIDYFEITNQQDPFRGFGAESLIHNEPVLVRALLHGESLGRLMQEQGAPPAPAELLLMGLARVCGFLDELHASGRGWLFWELSPDHIIVDPDNDFEPSFVGCGNFRMLKSGQTVTTDSAPCPDAGYAAPEQLCDGPCTTATDLYGLGALLFHIFSGIDPRDLAENILQRQLPRRSSQPALSPDQAARFCDELRTTIERFCRRNLKGLGIHRARLRHMILRCLHPDPADRFASPLELREAILNSLSRSMPLARRGNSH